MSSKTARGGNGAARLLADAAASRDQASKKAVKRRTSKTSHLQNKIQIWPDAYRLKG